MLLICTSCICTSCIVLLVCGQQRGGQAKEMATKEAMPPEEAKVTLSMWRVKPRRVKAWKGQGLLRVRLNTVMTMRIAAATTARRARIVVAPDAHLLLVALRDQDGRPRERRPEAMSSRAAQSPVAKRCLP